MEFLGRQDRVQPQKLAEGYCQTDQNARHRKQGLWTPRQGLSRPDGVGRFDERIDSLGYGECGLKTALLIEHGGSIEGYAIGVSDVNPVWTSPPARDWFYEAPTLTVAQTGDGEVTLTPSSDNVYVTTYNFYRDDAYLGSGDTWTDASGAGTFDYTVEAVAGVGVTSIPSTPVTAVVFGTYISDDFNRADGTLGLPWETSSSKYMKIVSQAITVVATGVPSVGSVRHTDECALPVVGSVAFERTAPLVLGSPLYVLAWELNWGGNSSGIQYDPVGDYWRLRISTVAHGSTYSAKTAGQPPASGIITLSISSGGVLIGTAGGVTLQDTGATPISPANPPALVIGSTGNDDVMFFDDLVFGGATP